jgi:Poly A polymerase regulatory subunit
MKPLTFADLTDIRAYDPSIRGVNRHYGQRKLAMEEIDFLTRVSSSACVLYLGAAPGHKSAFVASLFPNVKFLMMDPCDFDIVPHANVTVSTHTGKEPPLQTKLTHITIWQRAMTCEVATLLAQAWTQPFYVISDVRTAQYHDDPECSDIVYNLAQTYNWMRILKPTLSILKFRHPFHNQSDIEFRRETNSILMQTEIARAKRDGLDVIADYNRDRVVFFDGELMLQPWVANTSAETRLITACTTLRDWGDHLTYEGKMFHYNTTIRKTQAFSTQPVEGMCRCHDCALEQQVWLRYIASHPGAVMSKLVAELSATCGRMHAPVPVAYKESVML